jgi:hypothetical protein
VSERASAGWGQKRGLLRSLRKAIKVDILTSNLGLDFDSKD